RRIQMPDHILVLEQDPDLREILVTEIEEAMDIRVAGLGTDKKLTRTQLAGAVPVALYGRRGRGAKTLPGYVETVLLQSRSIQDELVRSTTLPPGATVMVISCWPDFLRLAKTVLLAVRLDSAELRFRNVRERNWKTGLTRPNTFVVTDAHVSRQLPSSCKA